MAFLEFRNFSTKTTINIFFFYKITSEKTFICIRYLVTLSIWNFSGELCTCFKLIVKSSFLYRKKISSILLYRRPSFHLIWPVTLLWCFSCMSLIYFIKLDYQSIGKVNNIEGFIIIEEILLSSLWCSSCMIIGKYFIKLDYRSQENRVFDPKMEGGIFDFI